MNLIADFLQGFASSYGQFFSWPALYQMITDPVNWGIIGSLVLLEGLLSADNALVLAIMVKHLPKAQQRKALFYGILGAYLFRFVAIGFGVFLVSITWVKVIGAVYLLWLPTKYFFFKSKEKDEEVKGSSFGFWRTILQVELMDIAFSIDSVLAAFGVSEKVWVLYIGAILGILMMRGVAQFFLVLIEKYPGLETTAYILIAIIGAKMMGSVFGFHMPEWAFFVALVIVFSGTFVLHYFRRYLVSRN